MIALQRLNGAPFVLNADLIESIEATPDTVIALVGGKKLVVKNSIEDVVRKAVRFKQLCNQTIRVENGTRDDESKRDT